MKPSRLKSCGAGSLRLSTRRSMQNFLKNFILLKQLPPFNVWNRIEEKLEEDIQEQYPAKLYDLEVAPPPQTWNKILTLLDEEKTIPEIPSKRKIISFVRYAAAACIIGLVALGAFKLMNPKNGQ